MFFAPISQIGDFMPCTIHKSHRIFCAVSQGNIRDLDILTILLCEILVRFTICLLQSEPVPVIMLEYNNRDSIVCGGKVPLRSLLQMGESMLTSFLDVGTQVLVLFILIAVGALLTKLGIITA